jgi:4-hydroxy-tetrahydrodipicolinate reductase
MNILIVGYGKMGKTIESLALEKGHEIIGKVDSFQELNDVITHGQQKIDVAIEFSQPDAAFDNIRFCLENNIPTVSGTTGWLDRKDEIHRICKENKGSFFYASNFSIGVNLFFKLNEYLAELMNEHPQYLVSMKEIHHTEKKDEPSGTAITLAQSILEKMGRIGNWTLNKDVSNSDLNIKSERVGNVPGTHIINYSSEIDRIEIKHEAFGREGFAMGAIFVAEWIPDKEGVLGMDDFLSFKAGIR